MLIVSQKGKTWEGDVYAKVSGNVETNHVIENWNQGSFVRYANELINMQ